MEITPNILESWINRYRLDLGRNVTSMSTSASTSSQLSYYNRGAVNRLHFIIDSSHSSKQLKIDAARILCRLTQEGKSASKYIEAVTKLGRLSEDTSIRPDDSWIQSTSAAWDARKKGLDQELATLKGTSNAEAIKNCCLELARCFEDAIDLNSATNNLNIAEQHASSWREKCDIRMHITLFFLETSSFSELIKQERLNKYLAALRKVYDTTNDKQVFLLDSRADTTFKLINGLLKLNEGHYKSAGSYFIDISFPFEPEANYTSLISAEDIALISSLCTVAYTDHNELKAMVDPQSEKYKKHFDEYLKIDSSARAIVNYTLDREYLKLFAIINNLMPKLKLDIYFSKHIDGIVDALKSNMICHYFVPYVKVSLGRMAADLSLNQQELDDFLVKLITKGAMEGVRIDGVNNTLLRKTEDNFSVLMRKAEDLFDSHLAALGSSILRSSLLAVDLAVKDEHIEHGMMGSVRRMDGPMMFTAGGVFVDDIE